MASRLFGYHAGNSFMHNQDALSKFMWLLVVSTLPFVMWKAWQVSLEALALLLISLFLSKIPLTDIFKSWRLFLLLGSLLFFFHITTRHEGTLLFKLWFLPINSDGVENGVLFGGRVVAIMGASNIFVRTTNPRELVVGLIHLGFNYRYAWMLFIALISLPVYESELVVIREAQAVRGIRPASNPFAEKIQMYRRYMMPMLASGLRKVENLAVGMDSRAFGAFPERTFIDSFTWSITGLAFLFATLIIFVILLTLRIRQA
jgi:energy-coupling factor transport system permease protein